MTGFGAAASEPAKKGGAALRVEIRTVNHKFLQVKARLPQELSFLESEVEELVRKTLDRGAVQVSVFASGAVGVETVGIDRAAASATSASSKVWPRSSASTRRAPGHADPAPRRDRDRRRSFGAAQARARGAGPGEAGARRARRDARDRGSLGRQGPRQAHARDRKARRADREAHADVVQEHRAALEKRVGDLLGDRGTLAPGDLAREIALLADKLDVSEELSRLRSHLAQLEALLAKDGPVGRQLDFLVQELFREANTVGSKCSDAARRARGGGAQDADRALCASRCRTSSEPCRDVARAA
jgi:uncharacterized protein YicC (UPF0701 family)